MRNGLEGDDVIAGGVGADDLEGGAGIDTLDYGASAAGVSVLLRGGDAFGGGDAQGDTIIGFENITGSAFNDVLVGDDGANALRGGGGNDQLTGGKGADVLDGSAGVDTARYDGSPQGVFVDMFNPIANGGDAAGDTLVSIENLTGSAFLDRLVGDGHANVLLGNGSVDALLGHGGERRLLALGKVSDTAATPNGNRHLSAWRPLPRHQTPAGSQRQPAGPSCRWRRSGSGRALPGPHGQPAEHASGRFSEGFSLRRAHRPLCAEPRPLTCSPPSGARR